MEEAPAPHAPEALLDDALDRIEHALARIEAAARDAAGLKLRHADLKASVARSLEGLDALLAARAAGTRD